MQLPVFKYRVGWSLRRTRWVELRSSDWADLGNRMSHIFQNCLRELEPTNCTLICDVEDSVSLQVHQILECHGDVTKMKEVRHVKPLGMAFCLKCHRHPEKALRPLDKVYDLSWKPKETNEGKELKKNWNIHPPTSCTGCHR